MDVKYSFLNGYINKVVYASQPPSFEDHENPNYVFKLQRALYGLIKLQELSMSALVDF